MRVIFFCNVLRISYEKNIFFAEIFVHMYVKFVVKYQNLRNDSLNSSFIRPLKIDILIKDVSLQQLLLFCVEDGKDGKEGKQ